MGKVGRQILSCVMKVDGEVVHVLDGATKRVHVVIRGVGVVRPMFLFGSFFLLFHFIILFWHFNV